MKFPNVGFLARGCLGASLVAACVAPISALAADLLDPEPAAILVGYQERTEFGYALAGGDFDADGFADLLVGAPEEVDRGDGAVYLFPGRSKGLSSTPVWSWAQDDDSDQMGVALGVADFDQDGYSDAAMGGGWSLDVYVANGSGLGLAGDPEAIPNPGWGGFGEEMDARGDANGDGYPDLLVGAIDERCYPTTPDSCLGFAFVYLGSPLGLAETPWSEIPFGWGGEYWSRLVFAGDTDGDGYDEVATAQGYDTRGSAVYVYQGGETGLEQEGAVDLGAWAGANDLYNFGVAMAAAGDMNGDGYADLAVGGSFETDGEWAGGVVVFLGSAAGTEAEPGVTLLDRRYPYWGSLGAGGDLDRDGFDDLLVGSEEAGDDGEGEREGLGGVYVYRGGTAVADPVPATVVLGMNYGDFLGDVVTQIGDTNGDGEADIAVTGDSYNNATGHVWVFNGTGESTPRDADSDGFEAADDCDDSNPAVNSEAVEVCNGIDDDCDRSTDEDASDASPWCVDADGDGATVGEPEIRCAAAGFAPCSDLEDCDDADVAVHPGAEEIEGDGVDQDCDGADVDGQDGTEGTKDPSCGCGSRAPPGLSFLIPALALAGLRSGRGPRFGLARG